MDVNIGLGRFMIPAANPGEYLKSNIIRRKSSKFGEI
jgi:hypothetical protein